MRPLLTPAQGRILRALVLFLSGNDGKALLPAASDVVAESVTTRAWASLTFVGERHHIVVRLPRGAAVVDLDGVQFDVAGALVVVENAAWTATDDGPQLTVDLLAIATGGTK